MRWNTHSARDLTLAYRAKGFLIALALAMALGGCDTADDNGGTDVANGDGPTPTVGFLNVSVTPASAAVVVTGPDDFSETFTGGRLLIGLEPGQYTATGTATGYGDAASSINVMPGLTSSVFLHLLMDTLPHGGGGSLNINVSPSAATVVVSGPEDFGESFLGNQLLTDLNAGKYSVSVTSAGFGDAHGEINVVLGQTSSITFVLLPLPIISEAPRAVYRDGRGNLIPLGPASLQAGPYFFFAWLEDEPGGISTAGMHTTDGGSPGRPTLSEQDESAPSLTQNLAAAWVGFTDADGVVRPVIGADVRWEIDQWWSGRVGSMQFGTSDDNRAALGYGVFDDQADTRTNNARLHAQGFPLYANEYPLFNQTGVGTPHTDGFTWVTLFSPDVIAQGRIVAVATINGEEIGKQILYKSFAPQPELQITKTVDNEVVNLVDGSASVTWTITVTNVGQGAATNVDLSDVLSLGSAAAYTAGSLPEGSTAVGDGFTTSFPLGAAGADDDTIELTFTATVTEPGAYCNEASIVEYEDAAQTWIPIELEDDACFVALESNVSIIKDFVAADDTTSLGRSRTVSTDEPARLRVRVINNGTGAASGVAVNDALTLGDGTKYQVLPGAPGTPNANNGFDVTIGTLAAGATSTLLFSVAASADGRYCDTVTLTAAAGTNIGIDQDTACLTVATPKLTITKVNAPQSVLPGSSYRSTIVVTNTGNATARDVVISDLLGFNSDISVWVEYVSSSLSGLAGVLFNRVVTASTFDLPAGQSRTFTVVSRVPLGAIAGTYCNTATVESSNADSEEASDCITVPAFSALLTQLTDINDPVAVGETVTYSSVLAVEQLSNEGVRSNVMTYSFGLTSPTVLGIPGEFREVSTKVYVDTSPVRDPVTGTVVSDATSASARLLVSGSGYTVDNSRPGMQVITITPTRVLQPNSAFYILHVVRVPAGTTANRLYTTSFVWECVGTGATPQSYEASSSEPTSVLP